MHRFRWLSARAIPAECDLTQCGWVLAADRADSFAITLNDLSVAPDDPARTLVVGVRDPGERERLLLAGFGEVVGDCTPGELAARAIRLGEWVPRYRRHAGLELDLVVRDAFVAGRGLNLHPREFGLLWRLMATPGETVGKARLLRDVWRLRHVPETNSLAVHACRLRSKLAAAGLADRIATSEDGYRFLADRDLPALPRRTGVDRPDTRLRLTGDPLLYETIKSRRRQA
jgi:DNA-binding winged helix-turn-helix (wHTH) protein